MSTFWVASHAGQVMSASVLIGFDMGLIITAPHGFNSSYPKARDWGADIISPQF